MIKKILFSCVALALATMSLASVTPVAAATIVDGDLVVTADSAAVYLISGSEKRVFPHLNVYLSWGYPSDFNTTKTVSASDLASYTDGTSIPFRDGSMFRGTSSSLQGKEASCVFYVEGGKLRPIFSAEVYQALFTDPDWVYVTWVPDDLLTKFDYGLGTNLDSSATYPNGTTVQYGGNKYLVSGGQLRQFASEAAYTANRYNANVTPVITVTDISAYTLGANVTGSESALVTPGAGAVVTPSTGTGLTIALASDTPASATIVKNAARVAFTKVNLTASSDGNVVVSLKVERTGLSSDSNISSVVFLEGSKQLGNEKSFNSDHQVRSDNITVSAGTTRTITIAANMYSTLKAGEVVGLDVVAVVTSATVNGALPVAGNDMTMNNTMVIGAVTVTRGVDDPNGTATKNVGTEDYIFISAKVAVDSIEAFDISLIEFTNATGSAADADLANLELLVDGAKYADGTMVSGVVTFDISANPVAIAKGKNKEFSLRGDIAGGSGRTVVFTIYDRIDIQAKGQKYGFYDLPDYPGATTAVAYWDPGNTVTIGAGSLSFGVGADQAANVPEGKTSVVVGTWEIKATGENVICTTAKFDIDITTSTTGAIGTDLTNVTLYDENGAAVTSAVDGVADAAATGDNSVSFTDTITFLVGTHVYTLKADLSTDFATDDTIQMGIDATSASNWTCKGELTNQPIAETPASAQTDAKVRTVKPGALAVTNSATVPMTGEYVVKGNTVAVAEVTFSAENSGEDVKITKIRASAAAPANASANELQNLRLFLKEGTVRVGSSSGSLVAAGAEIVDDSSSVSEFDETTAATADTADFNLTGANALYIPAGGSFTAQLKATVSNNCGASDTFLVAVTTGIVVTGVTSATDITETYTGIGQRFNISTGGTLTVNISSNTPAAGLIVPGSSQVITVFNLKANYEDITLDKIALEYNATSSGASADNSPNDIDRIYLTDSAGTVYGSADGYAVSATSTLIQNLSGATNKFIVPKDGNKDLYVRASINPIRVTATIATSGHQVGFRISGALSTSGSYVAGKSDASSEILATRGTGINLPVGANLYLRKGMPIVTFYGANSSGSFSGTGSQLSSSAGETKTAYYFKVAADTAGGDIALFSVVFDVATTTATATSFLWYDITEDSGTVLDNANATAENLEPHTQYRFYVDSALDASDEVGRRISTAAPHTFKLTMTAKQDAVETDDNITITPLGDATQAKGKVDFPADVNTYYAPTSTDILIDSQAITSSTAHFVWSDGSYDSDYATSTAQWYNGYKVSGLDATNTSYQVIFVD
ncbi:hypothetical protein KKD19_04660 [Patescibacteria group bacterium]|nr:hypothetical protein [Patescibacteria group bacterium]